MIEQLMAIAPSPERSSTTDLIQFMQEIKRQCQSKEDILFICIGSDRSSGDAFGPIVGSFLQQLGFPHVIGTLEAPCDAHAVEREIQHAKEQSKTIVAIDACLGQDKQVGKLLLKHQPIQPGAAIGRNLPYVGDFSIAGVVNVIGPKAYWKLQTTSLQLVLQMANTIGAAAQQTWK